LGEWVYIDRYSLPHIRDIVLLVLYGIWQEGGAMDNRRFQFMDRRQDMGMPKFPFKDSKGETIRADRRKIANRRLDDINFEWSDIPSI
jgi:hypothetical protein